MDIARHIEELSQRDLVQRREALSRILSHEGITYSLEEGGQNDIVNFTFTSCNNTGSKSGCLFTAHYDNARGSCGANDNMASVCILIDLWRKLEDENINACFLLTDGEEYGNVGAKLYCNTHNVKDFAGVICLDVCGYGDSIIVCGKGQEHKPVFRKLTGHEILRKHNAEITRYIPPGDDVIFRKYHVPTLSISIVPKWDVQYMKALASFGDRLLGQPPEFDMIYSQMEITQTMHGGSKDNPEYIQPEAMMKIYDYLSEAMTLPHENIRAKFSLSDIFRRLFI